jgi:hypothetical protein
MAGGEGDGIDRHGSVRQFHSWLSGPVRPDRVGLFVSCGPSRIHLSSVGGIIDFGMIEYLPGCDFLRDNCLMRQLSLFTPAQVAGMRDRTASRNHSPSRDQFRREHERHRAWGLVRRHAERLHRSQPPKANVAGQPQQGWTQDPSQTSAPALAEQPTRAVPGLNHPTSLLDPDRDPGGRAEGSSRGDPTPGAEPEPAGTSAETIMPRPREDPRPSTGNDRRRHGSGIRCHSHRPVPSEPISIKLQINAIVSAIPPRRNRQLYDRTPFLLSGRSP